MKPGLQPAGAVHYAAMLDGCVIGLFVGDDEVSAPGYSRLECAWKHEESRGGLVSTNPHDLRWAKAKSSWGAIDSVVIFDDRDRPVYMLAVDADELKASQRFVIEAGDLVIEQGISADDPGPTEG